MPLSAETFPQLSQSSVYSEGEHSLDPPIGGHQSAVEERKCQPCDVPQASPMSTRDMASILGQSDIYETSINTKPSSVSDITDSDSSDQPRADWRMHQSSTGGLDHHQHEQSPIMPLSSPSSKPGNIDQMSLERPAQSPITPETETNITAMIEKAIKKYREHLSPNQSPSPGLESQWRCFICKRHGHSQQDCPELFGNSDMEQNAWGLDIINMQSNGH